MPSTHSGHDSPGGVARPVPLDANSQRPHAPPLTGFLDPLRRLLGHVPAVAENDADVGGVEYASDGGSGELGSRAEVGDDGVEAIGEQHAGDAAGERVRERRLTGRAAEEPEAWLDLDRLGLGCECQRLARPDQPVIAEPREAARVETEALGEIGIWITVDGEREKITACELAREQLGDRRLADASLAGDRDLQRRTGRRCTPSATNSS